MIDTVWIQLIGFFGVVCILLTFQFNNRKTILRIQLLSGLLWTIHFALLGAFTGSALNLLSSLRNYLFEKYRKHSWIFWLVISAFVIATILTWKNWTSILPFIGVMIGTASMWQKKPQHMRWMFAFVPPFWFAYNALNGSYPGMLGDTIAFVSVVSGIVRFDVLPKIKNKASSQVTSEV